MKSTSGDVALAIEPMTDLNQIEQYFGTDLLKAGIYPVHVIVENRSSADSVLVSKEQFRVGSLESLGSSDPSRADVSTENAGQGIAIVGAALISLPLIFIGAKMVSNAAEVKHNLVVKELQKHTLSKGMSCSGFVYFAPPKDVANTAVIFVPKTLAGAALPELAVDFHWPFSEE